MTDLDIVKCQECEKEVVGFLDDSLAMEHHFEITGHRWYVVRLKSS